MILTEQLGQLLGLLGLRLHQARPAVLEQPLLVPEVLHALAPLVQVGRRRRAVGGRERLAAASVGALERAGQRLGAQLAERAAVLREAAERVGVCSGVGLLA